MNEQDKNLIAARYRDRLQQHGPGDRALASGTTERNAIRFGVLRSVGDLEGKRVLDLGCGLADFYAYLRQQGVNVHYTGYDITPEFITLARERYPDLRFELRDIQAEGVPERFDYIVSSQTFNNRFTHEDNLVVMKDILRLCYEACDLGVVVDMMTSYVDFQDERLYYYSPETIFSYAKSLTKRVTLRHDTPTFEFAIFLYKDFKGWSNK